MLLLGYHVGKLEVAVRLARLSRKASIDPSESTVMNGKTTSSWKRDLIGEVLRTEGVEGVYMMKTLVRPNHLAQGGAYQESMARSKRDIKRNFQYSTDGVQGHLNTTSKVAMDTKARRDLKHNTKKSISATLTMTM